MLGQDRPLLFYVLRENRKENQQTQLRAFQHVEDGSRPYVMAEEALHSIYSAVAPATPVSRNHLWPSQQWDRLHPHPIYRGNGTSSTAGHPSAAPDVGSTPARASRPWLNSSHPTPSTGPWTGRYTLGVRERGPGTVLVHGTQDRLLLPAGHSSTHPVLTSAVGSEGKAALGVETASTTGGGATTAGFASVSSAESSPLLESLPSAPVGKPMSCNTCRRETQAPSEGGLNHAEPLPHPGS